MKIGRNAPCPCGSGRKFKLCCIGVTRSADALETLSRLAPVLPEDRLYAEFVDLEDRLRIAVSNDVLFNHLRRDGPRIESSFDSMCAQDLAALNEEVCHLMATIAEVSTKLPNAPSKRELCATCLALLSNATQTFISAVDLARRGYRLQPGILLRNVLESVSTVCHVVIEENGLKKLKNGTLASTRTIASAKKVFPPFGRFYGLLSDSFTHIGHLHFSPHSGNAIKEYEVGEEALDFNLSALRFAIWSVTVTAELAFFDSLSKHRYFRRVSERAFVFSPSPSGRERIEQFLLAGV
ncbi:MAG: SEC-C metal-binding domain-containing protein [Gammaproteobacteria bacterium]|nr:SEC-C metal-binding domain-containing protein [Gammaproteobacteria bacterium]